MSTAMALVGKKSHTAVRTSSRDQRETKGARWPMGEAKGVHWAMGQLRGLRLIHPGISSGQFFFVAAIPARVLCTDVLRRLKSSRGTAAQAKFPSTSILH